jgi:AcrR family transcriptional regulator
LAARSARTASKKVAALKAETPVSGPALWSPVNLRVRDRERKRDAVIQAAARAFRARGYHNTSLDDIATDLNVTKPTVYHYVQNKEQLLFECFRTGLQQIMQAFDEVAESKAKARDRLAIVMTRYAEAIASDFGWCMVQAENQDLSAAMSRKVKTLKAEIDQGLRRLIAAGVKDGSLRPCDAKMAAFAIAGAFNWIAHWYRSGDALTATEIAEQFIDLFVKGLEK